MAKGAVAGYPMSTSGSPSSTASSTPSTPPTWPSSWPAASDAKAAMEAPVILEPVMDVEITVPERYLGDIMSDVNAAAARSRGPTVTARRPSPRCRSRAPEVRARPRSITQGEHLHSILALRRDAAESRRADRAFQKARTPRVTSSAHDSSSSARRDGPASPATSPPGSFRLLLRRHSAVDQGRSSWMTTAARSWSSLGDDALSAEDAGDWSASPAHGPPGRLPDPGDARRQAKSKAGDRAMEVYDRFQHSSLQRPCASRPRRPACWNPGLSDRMVGR